MGTQEYSEVTLKRSLNTGDKEDLAGKSWPIGDGEREGNYPSTLKTNVIVKVPIY